MDAFDAAGYGQRPIGWGHTPAVLAVDFQLAFTDPRYPMGASAHADAAVVAAGPVLAAARAAGWFVVHTRVGWSSPAEFGRWKVPALVEITPESEPAQIDPRVWEEGDLVLTKKHPSAFFGTDLSSVLRCHGVDTLLITGVTTSGCVRASVIDSFSYGFRTVVVTDACGDQDEAAHLANLADVGRRYADLIDSSEACRLLSTAPEGNPS